jgi:hypothetical protein
VRHSSEKFKIPYVQNLLFADLYSHKASTHGADGHNGPFLTRLRRPNQHPVPSLIGKETTSLNSSHPDLSPLLNISAARHRVDAPRRIFRAYCDGGFSSLAVMFVKGPSGATGGLFWAALLVLLEARIGRWFGGGEP